MSLLSRFRKTKPAVEPTPVDPEDFVEPIHVAEREPLLVNRTEQMKHQPEVGGLWEWEWSCGAAPIQGEGRFGNFFVYYRQRGNTPARLGASSESMSEAVENSRIGQPSGRVKAFGLGVGRSHPEIRGAGSGDPGAVVIDMAGTSENDMHDPNVRAAALLRALDDLDLVAFTKIGMKLEDLAGEMPTRNVHGNGRSETGLSTLSDPS